MAAYASSNALSRYFCPRCGASIANLEADEWEFATGVLDRIGGGFLRRLQMWLEDTKDGGAGLWLSDSHSERHLRDRSSGKLAFEDVKRMSEDIRTKITSSSTAQQRGDDVLPASCHCSAVSFQILRPDPASRGSRTSKYPSGLDACTSCRTVTGFEIASWAFVPRNRIRHGNSERLLDLLEMPALSYYKTSPGVTRAFCSTCGANVFYYRHRGNIGKEDTIDIAVGLLNSDAGARAEDWLVWDHYGEDVVAYREDALDREFVEVLVTGIRASGAP